MNPVKTVVSGIRATGRLHLGQYLGVLKRFARMSKDPNLNCFFFVADLHTLTTLKEAKLIRSHLPNIILDYLAVGVDYEKATIYVQSSVPSVTELSWYLSCLTQTPWLQGLPDYKQKVIQQPDDNNAGLLTYPVLMAADILGPRAHLVPVGKDQLPHLELAASIANKFNRTYGNYFPVPDAMSHEMITVPGLSLKTAHGFPKMGKSDDNAVLLSDSESETAQRIKVSPTDPRRARRSDPGEPEDCTIFQLHKLASTQEQQATLAAGCRNASIGCIECKGVLSDNVNELLREFRERRAELVEQKDLVHDILQTGQRKASEVFTKTLQHVRGVVGVDF